ncbi:MAG: triose-phosphate isomerase [Candidatus Vogelbacteria bacterium]|nr:triose-phosphate isomerase [Candidatus Vogelbacteria bacterium]
MAKKIIIGNWKMNPATRKDAMAIFSEVASGVKHFKKVSVVVCVPAVFLESINNLKLNSVSLGAENCFFDEMGPYTGEVSPLQLKNLGVQYVIVGHSERRVLGEDDELISKKIKSAVKAGLKIVFCVGERFRDEAGEYLNFLRNEITAGLSKIKREDLRSLIIAYEPVWAVGKNASGYPTPESVLEVALFLKKILVEMFGRDYSFKVPIVYGGSVDKNNTDAMLRLSGVDGLLVGRDSLSSEKFLMVIAVANSI